MATKDILSDDILKNQREQMLYLKSISEEDEIDEWVNELLDEK